MASKAEEKLAENKQHNSKMLMDSFMLYFTSTHSSELRKAHSRLDIVTTLIRKLNIKNK